MNLKKVALMEPAELFLFTLPVQAGEVQPEMMHRATFKRFLKPDESKLARGEYPTSCRKKPSKDAERGCWQLQSPSSLWSPY
jgi:hypothetical protein